VQGLNLDPWWVDVGTVEDLLKANHLVLRQTARRDICGQYDTESRLIGDVQLAPGSYVENSILRGPVQIDSGTRIVSSTVGPDTSIGKDCAIMRSQVARSVVLDGATVENVRLDESVVAAAATIVGHGPDHPGTQCGMRKGGRLYL